MSSLNAGAGFSCTDPKPAALAEGLCDRRRGGDFSLLGRFWLEVLRDEVIAQLLERVARRLGIMQQIEVLFRDRAPFGHRLESQHLIPVLPAVENHANLLGELVGLDKRQNLEQLVARPEAARENDQRLREVGEPELSHEEIVE